MNYNTKEIIYSFFLECLPYCNGDQDLKNLFEKLAYGNYIENGMIKGKGVSYKVFNKEPAVLFKEICDLFKYSKSNGNFLHQLYENDKVVLASYKKWGDIRKKSIKKIFIERYICSLHLDQVESVKLYKKYIRLFVSSSSNNSNVIIQNGNIVNILEPVESRESSSSSSREEPHQITHAQKKASSIWLKYKDGLDKL